MRRAGLAAAALALLLAPAAARAADIYPDAVAKTPGLVADWRLDEPAGTTAAADALGGAALTGDAPLLGAPGATDDGHTALGGGSLGGDAPATPDGLSVELWAYVPAEAKAGLSLGGRAALNIAPDKVTGVAFGGIVAGTTGPTHWHHLVLTAGANVIKLYVDGVLAQSTAAATPLDDKTSALALATQTAGARLDEVALYDAVLDPDTIQAHYTAGDDGGPPHVRIVSGPPQVSGDTHVVFTLAAAQGGTILTCIFDNTVTPCTDHAAYDTLTDGSKTFIVSGVDRYGRNDVPRDVTYQWYAAVAPRFLMAWLQPVAGANTGVAVGTIATDRPTTFACQGSVSPAIPGAYTPCRPPFVADTSKYLRWTVMLTGANGAHTEVEEFFGRRTGSVPLTRLDGQDLWTDISGSDPGADCRLDKAPWVRCDTQIHDVATGAHTFTARGKTLTTAPLTFVAQGSATTLTLFGLTFPAVVVRSAKLARRVPRVRFVLSQPAIVTLKVADHNGHPIGHRTVSAQAGANAVKLPDGVLGKAGAGRYRLSLTATSGKVTKSASVRFALVNRDR